MAFKRRVETTVDDERAALRAQHAALEELKHELAERVQSVQQRELELSFALSQAGGARPEPPQRPIPAADRGTEQREHAANEREQAVAKREQVAIAFEAHLAAREQELDLRAGQMETTSASGAEPAPVPEAKVTDARLAELDARLAEIRDAEALFLRTRDELADRSEAVAARERLVSQRERELDDREDGKGKWAEPELSEMEARLRRLEQQQPGEQTLGFSGGFRKLEQGSRPQRGG